MSLRLVIILVLALGSATASIFFANNWLQTQRTALSSYYANKAVTPETKVIKQELPVEVLVMRDDRPAGSFLTEEMVKWVPFPEEAALESYFVHERKGNEDQIIAELAGSVLKTGLSSGEPITRGKLVKPGDRGFLAAVLPAGQRAVSIPINATTGIAGFIFPGDLVDVILTHTLNDGSTKRRVSETILQGIRVLAVDQRVQDQDVSPALAKTATVEVSAKQAEMVAVAMQMGRLSMSLRSLALSEAEKNNVVDGMVVLQSGPTYTMDIQTSQLLNQPQKVKQEQQQETIRVFRGDSLVKIAVK